MPSPQQPAVVESLQQTLSLHLSQAEAYETQASHFQRWGYGKLADEYAMYAAEERGHAKKAIDRLEFFDVKPVLDHEVTEWPRHDFLGILDSNYLGDYQAAEVERAGYVLCVQSGDADSAAIFAELLHGSEQGMASIEAIKKVVSQIGVDNYLANKAT
jgi:bacterioferritin